MSIMDEWQTRDGTIRILLGDSEQIIPTLDAESGDACVTDPPYGLTQNKKGGSGTASVNLESPYGRARIGTGNGAGGFMGMKWDSGVPSIAAWQHVLRVLKPGAHLLCFAGTRTYHRMACNIEDAGFECRDLIAWVYGSGFPKSMDVSKAIDKAAGAERERIRGVRSGVVGSTFAQDAWSKEFKDSVLSSEPITADAAKWSGWGTALKPALEPVMVARKPLIGTVAANVLRYGTGAINVDAGRVEMGTEVVTTGQGTSDSIYGGGNGLRPAEMGTQQFVSHPQGRFPANLIHDGSEEVVELFPESVSTGGAGEASENFTSSKGIYGTFAPMQRANAGGLGDSGSAARFFYCAKASGDDRGEGNTHPTVKPIDLMMYLVKLVTPEGATVIEPYCGSGTTAAACYRLHRKCIAIEREPEYFRIAVERMKREQGKTPLFSEDVA